MSKIFIISGLCCFLLVSANSLLLHGQQNMTALSHIEHGVLTNDIWGYVDDKGTEYAVVGTQIDARIYELSDPTNPKLIAQIPGANSIWRDFKSYGNYIYQTTDQGNDGLRIIDMSFAPDSVGTKLWNNQVSINGASIAVPTCHNIWIDTISGRAFLAGCRAGAGGALILDLTSDPLNPTFIGFEDERYAHDLITIGDTLFASEIYEGNLAIYDITDKQNAKLISRTPTSSLFTHNAWPSDDGKYVFTTDERGNAFVDAYDISDLENPVFLDKYQPVANQGVVPHNAHYINGYLVVSWYTEGVIILDVSQPDNMVKVGQFDTDPNNIDGCWGAYPYLPSGLILASDLATGFWVLKPNYRRAAHIRGTVKAASSGAPISGASITFTELGITSLSNSLGMFKAGTPAERRTQVTISHPKYLSKTLSISTIAGETSRIDVTLEELPQFIIEGSVKDINGVGIPNAVISLSSNELNQEIKADENGTFSTSLLAGETEILSAAWGFKGKKEMVSISKNESIEIVLESGYEDDFFADLGWTVSSDAAAGLWTRAVPVQTLLNNLPANVSQDVPDDIGNYCYITGNDPRSVGFDDLDDGSTTLTSPAIDLSTYNTPIISLAAWFFNGGGNGVPDDSMTISITDDTTTIQALTLDLSNGTNGGWRDSLLIDIKELLPSAKRVKLVIRISDETGNGHIVEGGIDKFRLYEKEVTTSNNEVGLLTTNIIVAPNPTSESITINSSASTLKLYDITGRQLLTSCQNCTELSLKPLAEGTYILQVLKSDKLITTKKIVKI